MYTGLLVVINIQSYTPTNLMIPADHTMFTTGEVEEVERRDYVLKLVLVTECLQMIVI